MAITGDLGMGICLSVCDVTGGGKNLGSHYDQDSTAGSCHSLTLSPTYPPQNKKSRLCLVSRHVPETEKKHMER